VAVRCRGRLFLDEHPLQLPEIAAIQKTTHHASRGLLGALPVKLVPGRELESSVGTGHRNFHTGMEKAGELDHDRAGRAAIRWR
jgi:hypothetical protein